MMEVAMGDGEYLVEPTKIICLLRSYAAHARELDNEIPECPIFFLKPPSSLIENGGKVIIPNGSNNVHHEVELAVIIGKEGKDISENSAGSHILGFSVMLDITARDVQNEAKSNGLPWTRAKGYDTFAPFGPIIVPKDEFDWRGRSIWLEVNGERRQDSNTDLLLWPLERIISDLSKIMTLKKGDIIMTGTPAGVGPLCDGDHVKAGIDGLGVLEVVVGKRDNEELRG